MALDLLEEQKEAKFYSIGFVLWPKMWKQYAKRIKTKLNWRIFPFRKSSTLKIPARSGVYTFLVQPGIASHPACSYLLYVGKAEKETLRTRFQDYLREVASPKGRPKIIQLSKHKGYTFFCCAEVARASRIGKLEERLIDAYLPPYNEQFTAKVSRVIKALR